MSKALSLPPQDTKPDGSPRRVGVEIEFAGLDCRRVADMLAHRFGGGVEVIDPYRHIVETETRGRFVVELDTQFVHPDEAETPAKRAELERERLAEALGAGLRTAVGEVTRLYLPVEIGCPPVPIAALPELDSIIADLRAAGAEGTRESLAYAFGLQLNIDPPALDAATVLAYLRAYLVASPWLRGGIEVDLTRRILPFVQPFPKAYLRRVLDPDYAPDLGGLIADYLHDNPTRNRELDMLPLFAWLDPATVRRAVDDPRLKPRPALHYRLPDSRLDLPDWGIVQEWNRWAESVEALAADPAWLARASAAYLDHLNRDPLGEWALGDWAEAAVNWLRR